MGVMKGLHALYSAAVLAVLAGVALWVGLGEVVAWVGNPAPAALACAQAGPGAREGWVQISGCRLLLAEAVAETWVDRREIRKVYVPLIDPQASEVEDLGLLLVSEDEGLVARVRALRDAGERVHGLQTNLELVQRDPGYAAFSKKVPAELQLEILDAQARLQQLATSADMSPVRDVDGMLQARDWLDARLLGELAGALGPRLAPGFRLLRHGATPRLAWPLTLTVLGALFALACLGSLIGALAAMRNRKQPG